MSRDPAAASGPSGVKAAIGSGLAGEAASSAFAATVALAPVEGDPPAGQPTLARPGVLVWGWDALRYVFVYLGRRMDAEDRKHRLVEERDGAKRLVEATLVELGQVVLGESPGAPELASLIEAIEQTEARRLAVVSDSTAAEKFQQSDDLRLATEQAAAETEWKACDLGAAQLDKMLRQLDGKRREIDAEVSRLRDDPGTGDGDRPDTVRAALGERRVHLDAQYGSLRERAAGLRASTVAAERKLEQAIAARQQAAAAMAASLAGHARARTEADARIRELTLQIGRVATQVRFPIDALAPGTERVLRLEETIADRDRQVAALERMIGHYDVRKLATGLGLLSAILGALGASLWAILH